MSRHAAVPTEVAICPFESKKLLVNIHNLRKVSIWHRSSQYSKEPQIPKVFALWVRQLKKFDSSGTRDQPRNLRKIPQGRRGNPFTVMLVANCGKDSGADSGYFFFNWPKWSLSAALLGSQNLCLSLYPVPVTQTFFRKRLPVHINGH